RAVETAFVDLVLERSHAGDGLVILDGCAAGRDVDTRAQDSGYLAKLLFDALAVEHGQHAAHIQTGWWHVILLLLQPVDLLLTIARHARTARSVGWAGADPVAIIYSRKRRLPLRREYERSRRAAKPGPRPKSWRASVSITTWMTARATHASARLLDRVNGRC